MKNFEILINMSEEPKQCAIIEGLPMKWFS